MSRFNLRVRPIEGCLLNFRVAHAVLTGESLRTVARSFDLDYEDCRLRIFRYCMASNPVAFGAFGRPTLDQLRDAREAFLPASVVGNGSQKEGVLR